MGYRSRLGRIPKTEREKYVGKTCKEVFYLGSEGPVPYRPPGYEQLYEIGKTALRPKDMSEFYSFDLYDAAEYEFFILSKSGMLEIIEAYHSWILEMYTELESGTDEDRKRFIASKVRKWGDDSSKFGICPYYLDEPTENCDGFLVRSWNYEYAIFNLVHIYRTFDWENDYLIFSAW